MEKKGIAGIFKFWGDEIKKSITPSRQEQVYSLTSKFFKQMKDDTYLHGGMTPPEMYDFIDVLKGKIVTHKENEIKRLQSELDELNKLT